MAVTIDPRPSVFGDRLVVTGSYQAGDTSIDLSSMFAEIDAFILNPSSTQNQLVEEGSAPDESDAVTLKVLDIATFSGTTITIVPGQVGGVTKAGTFMAFGRRN